MIPSKLKQLWTNMLAAFKSTCIKPKQIVDRSSYLAKEELRFPMCENYSRRFLCLPMPDLVCPVACSMNQSKVSNGY
jgi:hypothetical protein